MMFILLQSGVRALVVTTLAVSATLVVLAWDTIESAGFGPIIIAAAWCAAVSTLGVFAIRREYRRQSGS
jgi:hypothetical protein